MAQIDFFYGRKTHMVLVFNGVLFQRWCKRWYQLSNTIHHPYIIKGVNLRTSYRFYHISTILAQYYWGTWKLQSSWKHKIESRAVESFILAFGAAESWPSNNPRGVGNATSFHTFFFTTKFNLAAMLLLGISFKLIGGSGTMWIRQLDWNILDSIVALVQHIDIHSPPRSRCW
jgi:hypothetical protein